jgi:hypothetical protein
MGKLIVEQGPDQGEFFDLEHDRATIGQGPLSDIALPDDSNLADPHCMVRRQGKDYYIHPLARSRPFLLNGRLVKEPACLFDGDRIALGKSVIVCQFALTGPRASRTLWRGLSPSQVIVSTATLVVVALLLAGVLLLYRIAATSDLQAPDGVTIATPTSTPLATGAPVLLPSSPTLTSVSSQR